MEQDNDNLSGLVRPIYAVQGLWNFANDAPIFESINASTATGAAPNTHLYLRSKDIAAYIQHDWKITPTFTLNTGRYEIYTPLSNKYNNIGHPVLGPTGSELSGMKLVPQNQLYNSDYGHYGPKVGFAWFPTTMAAKSSSAAVPLSPTTISTPLFENQSFDNVPAKLPSISAVLPPMPTRPYT